MPFLYGGRVNEIIEKMECARLLVGRCQHQNRRIVMDFTPVIHPEEANSASATIAAISTAQAPGGIGIVRISGREAERL